MYRSVLIPTSTIIPVISRVEFYYSNVWRSCGVSRIPLLQSDRRGTRGGGGGTSSGPPGGTESGCFVGGDGTRLTKITVVET